MSEDAGRSARTRQAIDLLIRASRMHLRSVEKLFGDTGLHRSQRKLLLYLSHLDRVPSQRELSDRFDVSPACMARALKGLTAGGYITRTENADDLRRNDIQITQKGLDIVRETQRTFDRVDQRCFAGMSDDEIDRLIALLDRVQDNLRRADAADEAN